MTTRSRPMWLPATVLAALVPVFVGLGVWQLQRAEEKKLLQQEYDQRANETPRRIGGQWQRMEELRFRHVVARGEYDPNYQILVDNRVHRGMAGYHVVTPLKLEGGETRVLVNRGWVELGASREQLPPIDTPRGIQEISGVATVPAEKVFTLGAPEPPDRGWQPVLLHLDMQRYAASVPFSVQPVVVLLDANVAGGFTREWSRLDAGIAVHRGYAVQWFALAGLAAVIFVLMWRRTRRRWKRVARAL